MLRAGGLVAIPTETVYGLGADAENSSAVERIFVAKGRPTTHPLIVQIRDAGQLDSWAAEVPKSARLLAERFWPGPLQPVLFTVRLLRRPIPRLPKGGLATPQTTSGGGALRDASSVVALACPSRLAVEKRLATPYRE